MLEQDAEQFCRRTASGMVPLIVFQSRCNNNGNSSGTDIFNDSFLQIKCKLRGATCFTYTLFLLLYAALFFIFYKMFIEYLCIVICTSIICLFRSHN